MKKIRRFLSMILYYGIASRLPNYSFPGGPIFNQFRVICLRGFTKIGSHNRIMKGVYLGNGRGIEIGNNCRINEKVRLDNVKIGNHVMIARESVVLGKTHETSDISKPMEQQGNIVMPQTKIGDNVWLGLRVALMPGLQIGEGSIIGAGAVVTKDVEPFSIFGGIPAKFIKKRKENGK